MSADDNLPAVPAGAPPSAPNPKLPTAVAESESELRERARELIAQLESAPQDRQLARSVGSIGNDAQQKAGHEIDLLKTKVGTLLNDLDGPGAKIPQGLMQLRKTMDDVNPHLLASKPQGWISKLLRRTPVIGDVLADIAVKYESVQTQIDHIIDGLRAGKDQLLQDSLELERLYDQVQNAQLEIQKAAFLGEMNPRWSEIKDAKSPLERAPFLLLLGVLLLFGFYPYPMVELISTGVEPLIEIIHAAEAGM